MKRLMLCGIAGVALTLSAWSGAASAANSSKRKIETEQEFREVVVERRLSSKHGYSMVHEDGTLSGDFGGEALTGTWSWDSKYFCRTAKLGSKKFPPNCQTVTVTGDKVTFGRNKGLGKKSKYRLEEPES